MMCIMFWQWCSAVLQGYVKFGNIPNKCDESEPKEMSLKTLRCFNSLVTTPVHPHNGVKNEVRVGLPLRHILEHEERCLQRLDNG